MDSEFVWNAYGSVIRFGRIKETKEAGSFIRSTGLMTKPMKHTPNGYTASDQTKAMKRNGIELMKFIISIPRVLWSRCFTSDYLFERRVAYAMGKANKE